MSESEDDGVGDREVAYRLFAAEFEDANLSYSEGEDDRSPNYVVTPTGARVNRLFAVGVLTEVEQVSEDVLRGRVVDPTGAFVTYAGQYQPDVQAFLERVETPTFVAMTGKARTFQPEDSDAIYTSVRPESINEVDAETRDRWTVQAAEQTLDRIGHTATALTLGVSGDDLEDALLERGAGEGLAAGVPIALDHYGTTPTYLDALRGLALDAARVVAGERDEVGELRSSPDETGTVSASDLADSSVDVSFPAGDTDAEETADPEPATQAQTSPSSPSQGASEATVSTTADETSSLEETPDPEGVDTTAASTEETGVEDDAGESELSAAPSSGDDGEDVVADSPDDLGDFDPEEFELDEETREQVESEYGTEFQTGTEVGEPGDADMDTPDVSPEDSTDGSAATGDSQATETEEVSETATAETGDSPAHEVGDVEQAATETEGVEDVTPEASESEEPEPAEPAPESDEPDESDADAGGEPDDLQGAVVELMGELDDSGGADREALVEEMADRYGVDADRTEDAIQEALMSGECYEPSDGTLKPI